MRRLSVIGAIALLVLAGVPLASAAPPPPARYVAGNIIAAQDNVTKWAFRFEVRTSPSGALQFGYYQAEGMTSGQDVQTRVQSTVDNIRFFRDASGATAAQFGGMECVISDPNRPAGECDPYELIVTDGSAVGQADTFCGGLPTCWNTFDILYGDISIYGTP